MLYETLGQPVIFLILIISGFLSGFIFDFLNILKKHIKINFFINFFAFLGVFLTIFIFYLINLKFNYGQFRFYTIFCFFLSLTIERFISCNILALTPDLCYNKIEKNYEDKNIKRKTKQRIKFKSRKERKNK